VQPEGAPLLHEPNFPGTDTPGTLTCATDASGDAANDDSGVGGYGFLADHPGTIYVVSELWPTAIREALASVARKKVHRAHDTTRPPLLAVPTAEAFGMFAVPAAIAAHLADVVAIQRVVAIGDCAPASAAFEGFRSKSGQIRSFVRNAYEHVAPEWLAVDVPRTLNTDPDRLSHPHGLELVMADARAAGLKVVHVRITDASWRLLEATTHLSLGNERGLAMMSDTVDAREGAAERAASAAYDMRPLTEP
jgi:hypothetical protein